MKQYDSSAALLSAGWCVVLLLPGMTREWLLGGASIYLHLAALIFAGILISRLLKPFILSAESFGQRLWRAFILPLAGAATYLLLIIASLWIRQLWDGGLMNIHDSVALFVQGIVATLVSFYVVVPYGLVCQFVLERVGRARD